MKTLVALALFLGMLACPVSAQQRDAYGGLIPPERYASGPYMRPVKIIRLDVIDFPHQCPLGAAACAEITSTSCDIRIPIRMNIEEGDGLATLRHEQAHCRGWGADHPD